MTEEQARLLNGVRQRRVFRFPDIRSDAGIRAADRVSCARVWNFFKKNCLDNQVVVLDSARESRRRYRTYRLIDPGRVEAMLADAPTPGCETRGADRACSETGPDTGKPTTLHYRLGDGRFAELILPAKPTARELRKLFRHLQIDLLDTDQEVGGVL